MDSHSNTDKKRRFMEILRQYDGVIRRICFMYAGPDYLFDDLYQETMANIWRGMDSFRGDAGLSTWLYRVAVNTCISWIRTNRRHTGHADIDQAVQMVAGDDASDREFMRQMYSLISRLAPLDKAIVMMRLDEKSYDEISAVTGLSRANVAVRLHRAKERLKTMATQSEQ